MPTIPDFSPTELHIIQSTLNERYGMSVEMHLADTEVALTPDDHEAALCPTVFWREDESNFFVFKTGEDHFRCQFFQNPSEVFLTDPFEFNNVGDCVITLLQLESDKTRDA